MCLILKIEMQQSKLHKFEMQNEMILECTLGIIEELCQMQSTHFGKMNADDISYAQSCINVLLSMVSTQSGVDAK